VNMVSEELFRRQLEVTEKLAATVGDNAATTRQVATTQKESNDLLREIHDEQKSGRQSAVEEVKEHITEEADRIAQGFDGVADRMEFWKKPQFWLAIIILAAASASDSIFKVLSLLKG